MKKLTVLAIIFILSQIFAVNVCFASSENKGGSLSGSAWMDSNNNDMQELDEASMADVIIFVENADSGKLVTAKTDAAGFYTISDLAYGSYNVWSENVTGATTAAQTVELSEVNGTNKVDMVFAPATVRTVDTVETVVNIYLPIINN